VKVGASDIPQRPDEGKNYLSQPRSNQVRPTDDFIDSIDPKLTSEAP
jgi:hypothetical protein